MTVHNVLDPTQILEDIEDVQDAVNDLDADVVLVQADVTDIKAVTDGLPTLTETVGTTTTTTIDTEYNLYINNAPLGVFKPIILKVWFLNQTATETVILRSYSRVADGGVWALEDIATFAGVQDPVVRIIELWPTRYGVRTTIERTGGAARAYPFEEFYEI